MKRCFCDQHWSTPRKHHSMLLRDARIGLSPTSTKIGLVCDEARMRSATQSCRVMGRSKVSFAHRPIGDETLLRDRLSVDDEFDRHFARSIDPRAFDVPVRLLVRSESAQIRARFFVEPRGDARGDFDRRRAGSRNSLAPSPIATSFALKSSRWLRPSLT